MKRNVKRLIAVIFTVLCILLLLSGCGKSGYVDGVKYTVIDDHAEVVDVQDKITDAVIASEFKKHPVTRISADAFDQSCIESVTIPDSVTEIGSGAFRYSSLKNIVIPDSVTEIDAEAFRYCASLESVTLSKGLEKIGSSAFRQSALREIVIPDGVTVINDHAFSECAELSKAVLPDGLNLIGYYAFSESGIKSIVIPDSVTFLYSSSFSDCTSLEKAVLPPDADYRSCSSVFENCTALTEVELKEGMGLVPASFFAGCTSLRKVTIPSTVTDVSDDAFLNCSSLENLNFIVNEDPPEGWCLDIWQAFNGCTSLHSVEVPAYARFLDSQPQSICFALNSADSIYPDMNYRFADSVGIAKVSLWDAVMSGELECVPHANGIDGFRLDIYNNTDGILQVDCSGEPPKGMYLYSESDDCQNMLITFLDPDVSCLVDPGDYLCVGASTACMNLHRDIPSGREKYTLKFLEADSPLRKLQDIFNDGDYSYAVKQAAVWIITDNAGFSDTQILTNSITFRSVIDMDDYNLAYSLVEQVRGN